MNSLSRRTRIRPISSRRRKRSGKAGKLGIVRLYGKDLKALREACYERDNGICVVCGRVLRLERGYSNSMEMAHVRTKRNNGDRLDNVRSKCRNCHHREHNPKAVPPKGI